VGIDFFDGDADLANLPPEAFGNTFDVDGSFDPNDSWLANATREDQLTAMRAWFLSRYCDPAEDTPYDAREGGYLFVHGGPHRPHDELHERFGRLVDSDVIEALADELVVVAPHPHLCPQAASMPS